MSVAIIKFFALFEEHLLVPIHAMFALIHTFGLRLRHLRLDTTSFGSQLLLTGGTNLLTSAVALISGTLLARLLEPSGRGELAAIQIWPAFISVLATLGLSDAVVFFTSQDDDRAAEYLVSAVVLLLLSAIPFIVAGYLLMPFMLAAQPASTIATSRWYLVIFVPLMATQGMLLHPLRGRRDFVPWNLLRILYGISWLLVIGLSMIFGPATPRSLASGYLVMLFALAGPAMLVLSKRLPGSYRLNWRLWRPMLTFGLPSVASAVPQAMNLRLDQMLMATMLPPDRLGYYVVAVAWSGVLAPFMNSVGTVLFPRVAMVKVPGVQANTLSFGVRLTVVLAITLGVPSFAVTPIALKLLFGQNFSAAIPAALILIVAGTILSMNSVLEEGLRGLGETRAIFWGELGGVVATVAALAFMLRALEIIGAALSSLLGYCVTASVLLFQLRKMTGCSLLFFLLPRSRDWVLLRQRLRQLLTLPTQSVDLG